MVSQPPGCSANFRQLIRDQGFFNDLDLGFKGKNLCSVVSHAGNRSLDLIQFDILQRRTGGILSIVNGNELVDTGGNEDFLDHWLRID